LKRLGRDLTCCGEGLHEFAFWLSAQLALIQIADGLLERDLLLVGSGVQPEVSETPHQSMLDLSR
jgi:hypothetical protein